MSIIVCATVSERIPCLIPSTGHSAWIFHVLLVPVRSSLWVFSAPSLKLQVWTSAWMCLRPCMSTLRWPDNLYAIIFGLGSSPFSARCVIGDDWKWIKSRDVSVYCRVVHFCTCELAQQCTETGLIIEVIRVMTVLLHRRLENDLQRPIRGTSLAVSGSEVHSRIQRVHSCFH